MEVEVLPAELGSKVHEEGKAQAVQHSDTTATLILRWSTLVSTKKDLKKSLSKN